MFSISCFERSTCLTDIEFGTVLTFKFVYTCGCVFILCFFLFEVVCDFVCEVSLKFVYSVTYVVYDFLKKLLAIFCVDLL